MAISVEEILEQPDAVKIAEKLQRVLSEETARRFAFREWLDENKKAEFINGTVILHSPAKKQHITVSQNLTTLTNIYSRIKKIGLVLSEKALISLSRNDYEPDMAFFKSVRAEQFTDDQMIFPAPDLIVEILSKSTAKHDRTLKKDDYAAHGIPEYWIIDPVKKQVEQYLLVSESATSYMPPFIHTIVDDIESRTIEGFKIPVVALFDEQANLAALQQLLKAN